LSSDSRKIGISSDHAGFQLKSKILSYLKAQGYDVDDFGPMSEERVDYPDFGYKLAEAIKSGAVSQGIAMCGSGIGISIALNRYASVRAALCHDVTTAKLAREHNDANVLVLGARLLDEQTALDCVKTFLATDFEGGRHADRVKKLSSCGG
jgi:ribose 5-phosphate isomerase B